MSLSASTLPPTAPRLRLPYGGGVMLSLAAVYTIWSSTFLALRVMVGDLPPLSASGARFLLAGVVLYMFLRLRGSAAPSLRQWALCVVSGSAMFLVGNGFVALAARDVPSGVTAMSIGSVPLFLTAMEAMGGQRPRARQWVGIALGFTGVVCMGGSLEHVRPQSLWLLIIAPIGWALASLLVRRCALPAGAMAGAAQLVGGGSSSLLVAHLAGERFIGWPETPSLLAFGYLVVFGSLLGYTASIYLLRNAPAALATSYAYVNPVFALLLGATLGGERVGPQALLAGALVVSGVAILIASPQQPVVTGRRRACRGDRRHSQRRKDIPRTS